VKLHKKYQQQKMIEMWILLSFLPLLSVGAVHQSKQLMFKDAENSFKQQHLFIFAFKVFHNNIFFLFLLFFILHFQFFLRMTSLRLTQATDDMKTE
jgi:hypothetical protein